MQNWIYSTKEKGCRMFNTNDYSVLKIQIQKKNNFLIPKD